MTYWQLCLLIWVVFTGACGWIAYSKDRSVGLWLFLGLLFGAFALLVIALLPDRQKFAWSRASRGLPSSRTLVPPPTASARSADAWRSRRMMTAITSATPAARPSKSRRRIPSP
jgi:hypothetical protein